jgi:uncharacterized protein
MTPVPSLVEQIAKALVDQPECVRADMVEGPEVTTLELRTAPHETGRVIGRPGRTGKAIRTLLGAIGPKLHKRFTLDIVEEKVASIYYGHAHLSLGGRARVSSC